MGLMPNLTITSPYVHSSRHIYHGQPYARVDFIPQSGLWIWPLQYVFSSVQQYYFVCTVFLNSRFANLMYYASD
jgi:hypothetical protein